jgi:hypothetical protein
MKPRAGTAGQNNSASVHRHFSPTQTRPHIDAERAAPEREPPQRGSDEGTLADAIWSSNTRGEGVAKRN